LDLEDLSGDLLDTLGNRPAMLRSKRDGSENEKIQGALWKVDPFVGHASPLYFYKRVLLPLSKRKGKMSTQGPGSIPCPAHGSWQPVAV
jgi:hypothetical protein